MEFYEKYKKYIIILSILILFLISSIFIYYKNYSKKKNKTISTIEEKEETLKKDLDNKEKDKIIPEVIEEYYVDIKGAVMNPGVYKLTSNSIVNDVISLSGGLNTDADTRCVNLSKKIKNEMVIYIYTKEEVNKLYEEEKSNDKDVICNNIKNDAYVDYTNPKENIDTSDQMINDEEIINDKININTADISMLSTLPNIGESKAKAIISKRNEKGKFNSIEEIKEVSGIGEATYEKIKDYITVE